MWPLLSSFILSPWEMSTNGLTPHTWSRRALNCGAPQGVKPVNLSCSSWLWGKAIQQDAALFSFYHQVYNGQRHVAVSSGLEDTGQPLHGTGEPPSTTQRGLHAGEVRVIVAAWRHGGSHTSSSDYRFTHSRNSRKICNSELILDSLSGLITAVTQPALQSLGLPSRLWKGAAHLLHPFLTRRSGGCNGPVRSMDAAVRALQEPGSPAQQHLANQVCETHWFPRGV